MTWRIWKTGETAEQAWALILGNIRRLNGNS